MENRALQAWRERGAYHEIEGRRIFVVEEGEGEEALVFLHGYPTCSFDFHRVLPMLATRYRLVLHDQLGFGLSDKPLDYSYSLIEQAEVALQLWQKLGIREAHLVAHDYGTSVATELIARRERGFETVKLLSATLCNGSMLIELSQLRVIQVLLRNRTIGPWVARLSSRRVFNWNMRRLWGDPARVNPEELDALWTMLLYNDGRRVLSQTTQYLRERYRFWHRWIGSLYRTDLPVHILWAEEDPVAVAAMAHELHRNIPNNHLTLLPGLGHYPMLEDAEKWGKAVLEKL